MQATIPLPLESSKQVLCSAILKLQHLCVFDQILKACKRKFHPAETKSKSYHFETFQSNILGLCLKSAFTKFMKAIKSYFWPVSVSHLIKNMLRSFSNFKTDIIYCFRRFLSDFAWMLLKLINGILKLKPRDS